MLCAFWNMRRNPSQNYNRYINARAYDNIRNEYINNLSNLMKIKQTGCNNSIYGKHWFTNRNTGECKPFVNKPDETWIEGRFLFRGECSKLKLIKEKTISTKKLQKIVKQQEYDKNESVKIKKLWDDFNNSNYESLSNFCKYINYSQALISYKFKKYIPIYTKLSSRRIKYKPNKNLIGVYE